MGSFAVSCGWNPEGASEVIFNEKVIAAVCGAWKPEEPEPPLAPNLRQLYWECLQAVVADTRHKHDYTVNDVPRPLHSAERSHRRNLFRNKMVLAIPDIMTEDLEPAHCCEDDCVSMFETNRLSMYLHPMDCPTRRQELAVTTARPAARRPKAAGALAMLSMAMEETEARVQSDISDTFRLEKAFKRRGIALETSGLLPYVAHEAWRRKLFSAMAQTPAHPADSAPAIPDILAADKHIWILLSEKCIAGVRPTGMGHPMEKHLPGILDCYEVQSLLICRPRSKAAKATEEPPQPSDKQGKNEAKRPKQTKQEAKAESTGQKNSKLNEENAALKKQLRESKNHKGAKRGKGKGKHGKGTRKGKKGKPNGKNGNKGQEGRKGSEN